jgi:hypothetical protein
MVLSRGKRLNAGKAPARLNKSALSTLPSSAQLKLLKRACLRSKEVSTASKALKSLKKAVLQPVKRLALSLLNRRPSRPCSPLLYLPLFIKRRISLLPY